MSTKNTGNGDTPRPRRTRGSRPAENPADELDPVLRERLERLPQEPGVYLMKDRKGRIIYVGKAASLRARVRSYFTRTGDTRAFVALLGRLLGDIETVVTNNEKEALLLENNLIKQHQPRFNVKLVDDKNYLVLRLDPKARYPRLEVTRRIGDDGALYFGPYHSAGACRQTLQVVNRHFKLRTCSDHVLNSRSRPCLQYQIKRCDAPCVYPVPEQDYARQVQDVALFLRGRDSELMERLSERMKEAARKEEFEIAGSVRDQIRALEKTLEEQRVVSTELRDQDVFGLYREGVAVEIVVLHVRHGKLLGRRNYSFGGQEFPTEEILSSFVSLYYDLGAFVPDEVLVPIELEDARVKGDWLTERRGGRKVEVIAPQRGPRRKLVELADKNAAAAFVTRRNKAEDAEAALVRMQSRLNLRRMPRRIECYDISHLQGALTVASRVVFVDGEPARALYRTFKVKTATNDDFASMYEVLSRRFRRSKGVPPEDPWALPDLIVIDGGKGQLSTALAALRDADLGKAAAELDVVGLAKEREDVEGDKRPDRVFLARAKDPIPLKANSAELFLLMRVRDEAHRVAVRFNRARRRSVALRSSLEDVPGIGPGRKRALLRHLGSLRQVRAASIHELAAAPGMTVAAAEAVFAFFHPVQPPGEGAARGGQDAARGGGAAEVTEDAAAAELAALEASPEEGVDDQESVEAEQSVDAIEELS